MSESRDDVAHVERLDRDGSWRRIHTTSRDDQILRARMREAKAENPKSRIRAVDREGRLLDLMP